MTTITNTNSAREIVLAFINALNNEDFAVARQYLHDDLTFIGVLGTRTGADVYISEMSRMKFKYTVKKSFEEGSDVSLYYDINMGDKTIFCSGWYELKDNKISLFRVVFDPRPLFEERKG
ncbi:MAG: nuclear transport factor 2 family protein [Chitinophaga sp.]|uniref:nuclear transport factor 2 family protein n=1 Tax=Chitinophaga sp. TaxID=1869181 RepID=UPI001B2BAA14|nr:nuclear transport factor 2 family protein [Chitinophaga sp.]MBO9728322.1 nuclear transport factor 2 family protein [Chitinophaga sp.]